MDLQIKTQLIRLDLLPSMYNMLQYIICSLLDNIVFLLIKEIHQILIPS